MVLGSTGCLGTSLEMVLKNEKNIQYKGFSHSDLEITDSKEIHYAIKQVKPSIIINTVALIGINFCEKNPQKTMAINAYSVFELAKICRQKKITFVQASTHAVFNGETQFSYSEKDMPNPINIYGHSKLIAEYFVKMNLKDYYIFRFPTMYGPRRNKTLGFVDKMIANMQEGRSLKIAGDRIDCPSYALNISKKINYILNRKFKRGIYHIFDLGRISYYDFIKKIAEEIGFRGKIKKVKDKEFPSLAPNPLRLPLKSKKGCTNVSWKKAIKMYVRNESIKC